jgi:hypothetical protein
LSQKIGREANEGVKKKIKEVILSIHGFRPGFFSGVDDAFSSDSMDTHFCFEIFIFNILVLSKRPDKGLLKLVFLHYC